MRTSSWAIPAFAVVMIGGALVLPSPAGASRSERGTLLPAPGDISPLVLDASGATVEPIEPADAATLLDQRVPEGSTQAVLVTGTARNSRRTVAVTRWTLSPQGVWTQDGTAARGHIGARGWGKQVRGDYRTPIGTFTLTSAGGRLPAPPGTRLPYDHRPTRYYKTTGYADYVVRINYNVPVSAWNTRPTSPVTIDSSRGSGIWLHVDSYRRSPTAGCVSQPEADMATTLQWLDPAAHPVIVLAPGPYLVEVPWLASSAPAEPPIDPSVPDPSATPTPTPTPTVAPTSGAAPGSSGEPAAV